MTLQEFIKSVGYATAPREDQVEEALRAFVKFVKDREISLKRKHPTWTGAMCAQMAFNQTAVDFGLEEPEP